MKLGFLFACGGFLVLAAQGGDFPPFTAKGTVLTEVFQHPTGPPTARMEEAITFCHSNDWWRIELTYQSGSHASIPAHLIKGNTIDCARIPGGVRILTTRTPALRAGTYLPADVEATEFPPPSQNSLFVCWLTLCPKPQLPLLTETNMRRLVSAQFIKDPLNQGKYGLKYLGGGVFVSELCITNDGIIQVSSQSPGYATRRQPPPFDNGLFEFEYKVLAVTNWGGVSFPLKSVLRKYTANLNGTNRNDVRLVVMASLNVDSFRPNEIAKPVVDSSRIVALDNRYPVTGQGPLKYVVANENWLGAVTPPPPGWSNKSRPPPPADEEE